MSKASKTGAPKGLLLTAEQFNLLVPVGREVRYYPVAGVPEYEDTTTRSGAWELGDGSPVVKVVGRAGGVHLEHLELRAWQEPSIGVCPDCQEPQFRCPSGIVCKNGHGY